jgi:uncharacterized protein (TIGR02145 family)
MTYKINLCFYAFILLQLIVITISGCKKNEYGKQITAKDIDGNTYSTVTIGNQEWFAENLRTTKYNNGSAIPNITSSSEWSILTSDAYAWYNNDEATYKETYGALYNWYAVETGNLCPTGWRVPSEEDWTILTDYVGSKVGNKLKATSGWNSGGNGTDDFGFSAIPAGGRYYYYGFFGNLGSIGSWWSSTEYDEALACYRFLHYSSESLTGDYYNYKKHGFSVRCVRDN